MNLDELQTLCDEQEILGREGHTIRGMLKLSMPIKKPPRNRRIRTPFGLGHIINWKFEITDDSCKGEVAFWIEIDKVRRYIACMRRIGRVE